MRMEIAGRVVDEQGHPVAGARVDACDQRRAVVAQASSDEGGGFACRGEGIIQLVVYPPGWGTSAGRMGLLPSIVRIPGVPWPSRVELDVTLSAALPLPLLVFSPDCRRLGRPSPELRRLLAHVTFWDLDDRPATGAFHWGEEDDGPALLLPPGKARVVRLLWTAGSYGRLICTAADGGRGFVAEREGGPPLFLNVAVAESAWRRLENEVQRCRTAAIGSIRRSRPGRSRPRRTWPHSPRPTSPRSPRSRGTPSGRPSPTAPWRRACTQASSS